MKPRHEKPDSLYGATSRRDFLQSIMATGLVGVAGPLTMHPAMLRGATAPSAGEEGVLSLDALSGDWMRMSALGINPAINNFWGALGVTDNLLAVTELTFPPFSQGQHSGCLRINGEELKADESRWYAYQVLRRGRTADLEVESSVRMVFEGCGVLFRLTLRNLQSSAQQLEASVDLNGFIARYDSDWAFRFPRPQDPNDFAAALAANDTQMLIRHAKSPARVAFAFRHKPNQLEPMWTHGRAAWRITVNPGQERTIDFVMAVGNGDDEPVSLAGKWAAEFEPTFAAAESQWERRYADVFVPGNNFYSGNLPVLTTSDEAMRRVYYLGVLSRLQMLRTNLPVQPRITVTGGPQFAVTVTYFWDNTLLLMSMLDPEMMRQQLKRWLTLDIYKWNAQDCLSGEGRGRWYSANNLSVFGLLQGYLRLTGDFALLDERAGDKTVLEHLKGLVTGWKQLVRPNGQLADYGEARNLLECDSTYIHEVASLNAANVGMMRMLAGLLEWRGDAHGAAELRESAKSLAAAVLKLYVPGEGVWLCAQPISRFLKVRHVYDFITVVKWMAEDLSPSMRREMVAFVQRELMTEWWMRALSLQDPAAPGSDRPDHGPMGAYDEWPPLTLEAFCKLGYRKEALDAFYRFERITHEGPYAQAHEVLGTHYSDLVRIAGRGAMTTHTMIGTVFSELIVSSFFGFQPDWQGKQMLIESSLPPGFEGKLSGLPYRGKRYDLTAGANGVTFKLS
ncbi:MAG: hypothetical protein ABSF45_10080 [Terriglobia bacterium]|jgi:hypothetical protein